jgi:hypothetical protein
VRECSHYGHSQASTSTSTSKLPPKVCRMHEQNTGISGLPSRRCSLASPMIDQSKIAEAASPTHRALIRRDSPKWTEARQGRDVLVALERLCMCQKRSVLRVPVRLSPSVTSAFVRDPHFLGDEMKLP